MAARYKDPTLQCAYTGFLKLAADRNSELYRFDCGICKFIRGDTIAMNRRAFWDGFDGTMVKGYSKQTRIPYPRNSQTYAIYMAGREWAKNELPDWFDQDLKWRGI